MDVRMPEMDGLEATKRIRAYEVEMGWDRTPILALTAHTARTQHLQCLEHGMDAVVTKPVNLPDLLHEIAALAGGAAKQDVAV